MACERIARTDPATGARILQLTSFPVTHWNMGLGDSITPDGTKILLGANRFAGRGAPRDLYGVRSDGDDLHLLLQDHSGGVISPDGRWVFSGCGGSVVRLPFDGGAPEPFFPGDAYDHIMVSAGSRDGALLFAQGRRKKDGVFEVLRIETGSGKASVIVRASYIMPVLRADPNGERLVASIAPVDETGQPAMPWGVWNFSVDGTDFKIVPFSRSTNHYCPMGSSGVVVTTAAHPGQALDVASAGGTEKVLSFGAGFWHVSSDAEGEWLASDTNWPDTGLQLVNGATGRYGTICMTGASGGHPQWTHAHPVMSPDARWVVYTSDVTGFQQVYLVEIPDELKRKLRPDRR